MAAPTAQELAGLIEGHLRQAWKDLHNQEELPTPVNNDGRALFLAIARGVVQFMHDHKGDFVTSIRMKIPPIPLSIPGVSTTEVTRNFDVSNLEFNL